jgi:hypothetical protein
VDVNGLLGPLVGRELHTVTGNRNRVLAVNEDQVLVATDRSPDGKPVPVDWITNAVARVENGEALELTVAALGYRSSFVGAVLLALPGVRLVKKTPPTVQLVDNRAAYMLDQAGIVNAWWADEPGQRFWLEVTDRRDIGIDLHCPQRSSNGERSSGFSLIWSVRPGDIVFHYSLAADAITAWSWAAGEVAEAPTIWRSHRGATRRRVREAVPQPGWWRDLDGPFPLAQPLTMAELTADQGLIREVLAELEDRVTGSLYFPFFWWSGWQLRPMQYYLNKLPIELVRRFSKLSAAIEQASPPAAKPGPESVLGTDYREAQVSTSGGERQPFTVDPALVERGLRGHADTQNALARRLREAGLIPRSRLPHEPNFDLAWQAGEIVHVAEVKSITDANEVEQLRLGLGQVLHYRHQLLALGYSQVVAVLVPERTPLDSSWLELCRDLGVVLLAGDRLDAHPDMLNFTPAG